MQWECACACERECKEGRAERGHCSVTHLQLLLLEKGAKLPGKQLLQLPAAKNVPGLQVESQELLPGAATKLASHAVHSSLLVAPVALLKVLLGHNVQLEESGLG